MRNELLEVFITSREISEELSISLESAEELVKELGSRLEQMGYIYIKGKIPKVFYQRMKEQAFMSDEGKVYLERVPLTEKRLLDISEFCEYSGLGKVSAYKFAKKTGIEKRIGRRVLFDRELFDRWCDENAAVEI